MRVPVLHDPTLDRRLLTCLFALVLFGLVILYSASYPLAVERFGDGWFYFRRQLMGLAIGLLGLAAATRIPYRVWSKVALPLVAIATLLSLLVYIPGLGISAGGARRWINLGIGRFQPSELAKLALVIFLSRSLYRRSDWIDSFPRGILPHFIVPSVLMLAVLGQPDFGSFALMAGILFFMLFIGGARLRHLGALVAVGAPALAALVLSSPYRRERWLAFLDPWKSVQEGGFQIIQSHVAFHLGGWTGVGLGQGKQKFFYLPDIHTDFIMALIGEELGLFGLVLIILLFGLFTALGLGIARRAHHAGARFGCYLATGLTLLVGLPAFTNMAVAVGLLPTKGMVLPFLSYGSSSLVVLLFATGILLNISRGIWREETL